MRDSEIQITLLPSRESITAVAGETLMDALLNGGASILHECGGNCACTTCAVEVITGFDNLSRMEETERDRLTLEGKLIAGARLACQALVLNSPIIILYNNNFIS